MTATDASFLRIETEHEPQHVGSLSILEGRPLRNKDGSLDVDRLRAHVARRLHRVPRLRQRIMEVPFRQGRPVWVDDAAFDLDYHVRVTALAKPGNDAQLSTLMGRLQSLPLDRRRPLWEMWFIDGLDSDEVGLVIKTHHTMGDGIATVDLAVALVDLEASPPPDAEPPPWSPRPAPSGSDLLAGSVQHQLTRPLRVGRATLGAARDPRPAIEAATQVMRTAVSFSRRPAKAPWNQKVTPHRRWEHVDIPIDTVRRIRGNSEATINDVVLAACTGSIRQFLADHGHDPNTRTINAMVPVSIRGDDEHGETLGNRISLIIVELPTDEPDPKRRLERIHATTSSLKADAGLMHGAQFIIELADVVPTIAVPLTRFVSHSIPMNLVITNVPGPPIPLYLQGARILRTYPYVEVIDNEGLTMAVVSYEDHLFFGLTSDRDALPDLGRLATGIAEGFQVLLDSVASVRSPAHGGATSFE